MLTIVLSPEGEHPGETDILPQLFDAGLARYHVRKPGWSREHLRDWLKALPAGVLNRCVLHSHHELLNELPVLGRHWPDQGGDGPDPGAGYTSRSCHDLSTLVPSLRRFSAVFYSPIFASFSKPGHGPTGDLGLVSSVLKARTQAERRTQVFALGGVSPDRVAACAAWGFDGVAVLGWVWQAPDPAQAFRELIRSLPTDHGS